MRGADGRMQEHITRDDDGSVSHEIEEVPAERPRGIEEEKIAPGVHMEMIPLGRVG